MKEIDDLLNHVKQICLHHPSKWPMSMPTMQIALMMILEPYDYARQERDVNAVPPLVKDV